MNIWVHKNSSLHQARVPSREASRQRLDGAGRRHSADIETLFASDAAAAIERFLDDVSDSLESTVADGVLPPLRQALCEAFLTGDDGAWRTVYLQTATVIDAVGSHATPPIERLRTFIAENHDLEADPEREA